MLRFIIASAIGAISFLPSAAQASSISFQVQNQITDAVIENTAYAACGKASPLLPSVAPGSTSPLAGAGCGFSSRVDFTYVAGTKKCNYSILVYFDSIMGTYNPTGGAASAGTTKATCKILFAGFGGAGNYSYLATMM